MKRILIFLAAVAIIFAACEPKIEDQLSVTPVLLEFDGGEGVQTLTVTSSVTWALKQTSGDEWCKPSRTYGKSSTTVDVTVTANGPAARTAELVFSASGSESVTVTVKQAAGSAEVEVEKGEFYPDPASGIDVEPVCPDAD